MTEDEELAMALAMSAGSAPSSSKEAPLAASSAGASASAAPAAALGAAVPSIASKQGVEDAPLPDPLVAEDTQPAKKACPLPTATTAA